MKKINEELIHKYVDNELSAEELKELNELLNSDPEAIQKIKAVKFVESTISNSEPIQAPSGFTQKIMLSINSSAAAIKQDTKFFKAIISAFIFLITAVFIASFFVVPFTNNDHTNSIKEFVNKISFDGVIALLQNESFLMIGGGIIVLLVFSVVFLVESHKNFKNKLNTYIG